MTVWGGEGRGRNEVKQREGEVRGRGVMGDAETWVARGREEEG